MSPWWPDGRGAEKPTFLGFLLSVNTASKNSLIHRELVNQFNVSLALPQICQKHKLPDYNLFLCQGVQQQQVHVPSNYDIKSHYSQCLSCNTQQQGKKIKQQSNYWDKQHTAGNWFNSQHTDCCFCISINHLAKLYSSTATSCKEQRDVMLPGFICRSFRTYLGKLI